MQKDDEPYEIDDSPLDISEIYAAGSAVFRATGWDDPEMDIYDEYYGDLKKGELTDTEE